MSFFLFDGYVNQRKNNQGSLMMEWTQNDLIVFVFVAIV